MEANDRLGTYLATPLSGEPRCPTALTTLAHIRCGIAWRAKGNRGRHHTQANDLPKVTAQARHTWPELANRRIPGRYPPGVRSRRETRKRLGKLSTKAAPLATPFERRRTGLLYFLSDRRTSTVGHVET